MEYCPILATYYTLPIALIVSRPLTFQCIALHAVNVTSVKHIKKLQWKRACLRIRVYIFIYLCKNVKDTLKH